VDREAGETGGQVEEAQTPSLRSTDHFTPTIRTAATTARHSEPARQIRTVVGDP
jgi:hypothetical protein